EGVVDGVIEEAPRQGQEQREGQTEDERLLHAVASLRRSPALAAALLAALALLVAHSLYYWFLTDDAYISFRYARNLADGYGLVFNPGFERVEGYSNLLWVLLLAGAHACGLVIERVAPVLSLAATVGLALLVARAAWIWTPPTRRAWVWLPLALLGATR